MFVEVEMECVSLHMVLEPSLDKEVAVEGHMLVDLMVEHVRHFAMMKLLMAEYHMLVKSKVEAMGHLAWLEKMILVEL